MQKLTVVAALFSCSLLLSCSDDNKTADRSPVHVDATIKEDHPMPREELKGNYLIGTTVLHGSLLNLESRWEHGLALDSLLSSECSTPESESPASARITNIFHPDDSTLVITASIEENCSFSFLGELQIISGNTINLIYQRYGGGGFAACNCCFGLTYKIRLVKDEGHRFDQLKFVSLNGYAKIKLPPLH